MGRLAIALAAACACLCTAAAASAETETVLVLQGRHVHVRHERFLGRTDVKARPAAVGKKKRAPRGRATRKALDDLLVQGQIDQPTHDTRLASLRRALRAYASVSATRKAQMAAVLDNADHMA